MFRRSGKEKPKMRVFSDDAADYGRTVKQRKQYGANSSKELSGHRPSSKKQFRAGVVTPAPSQVTEISPGPVCNSFRALLRLRRAQTGRKKAPYPQIVYLLIRENNWVEFIISRVPAHRCALLFLFVFTDLVLFAQTVHTSAFHTADIFECPFECSLYFATFR